MGYTQKPINAKRKAGKKPRKPGSKGAPTDQDFKNAAKTAKKNKNLVEVAMAGKRCLDPNSYKKKPKKKK